MGSAGGGLALLAGCSSGYATTARLASWSGEGAELCERAQLLGQPAGRVGQEHEPVELHGERTGGPVAQRALGGGQAAEAGAGEEHDAGGPLAGGGDRPDVIGGLRAGEEALE